jgi:chromate transport protein ChrA
MDFIRKVGYVRFGLTAALVGAAAYVAPSIWATDRVLMGFVSFDQITFVLSLVLAYAALRVGDPSLRSKLAIGVIAAFVIAAAVLLAFSIESLVLLVLALAVGYFEWPREAEAARAY